MDRYLLKGITFTTPEFYGNYMDGHMNNHNSYLNLGDLVGGPNGHRCCCADDHAIGIQPELSQLTADVPHDRVELRRGGLCAASTQV